MQSEGIKACPTGYILCDSICKGLVWSGCVSQMSLCYKLFCQSGDVEMEEALEDGA